jgi:hypothetical protein
MPHLKTVVVLLLSLLLFPSCLGVVDDEDPPIVRASAFRQGDAYLYNFGYIDASEHVPTRVSGYLAVTVLGTEDIPFHDHNGYYSCNIWNVLTKYNTGSDSISTDSIYSYKIYVETVDSSLVERAYTPVSWGMSLLKRTALEPDKGTNAAGDSTYFDNELVIVFPAFLGVGREWWRKPGYSSAKIESYHSIDLNGTSTPSYEVTVTQTYLTYTYYINETGVLKGEVPVDPNDPQPYGFSLNRLAALHNQTQILQPVPH